MGTDRATGPISTIVWPLAAVVGLAIRLEHLGHNAAGDCRGHARAAEPVIVGAVDMYAQFGICGIQVTASGSIRCQSVARRYHVRLGEFVIPCRSTRRVFGD